MNNQEKDQFDYTYSAPDEQEREEIEGIRNKYLPKKSASEGIRELKKLDNRAEMMGFWCFAVVGILGILFFVGGIILCLFANKGGTKAAFLGGGLTLCVLGIVALILAFPIRSWVNRFSRKIYGSRILKISDEILSSERVSDTRSHEE